MSYTPQLQRFRSGQPATVVSYSPVCPRHQVTEKLIQHDVSSDGGSLFYSTPSHQHHPGSCASYGTLYQQQPNTAAQLQLLDMSTPSSSGSENCSSNTYVLQTKINKPLAWIWVVSCFLILTNNLFTLLQPFWLQNKETGASLGLINFCLEVGETNPDGEQCAFYGSAGRMSLAAREFPLQVTLALFTLATVFLTMGSVLAATCICVNNASKRENVSFVAGYFQLFSGE